MQKEFDDFIKDKYITVNDRPNLPYNCAVINVIIFNLIKKF